MSYKKCQIQIFTLPVDLLNKRSDLITTIGRLKDYRTCADFKNPHSSLHNRIIIVNAKGPCFQMSLF